MTWGLNLVCNFSRYQSKGASQRPARLRQSVLNIVDIGFDCLETLAEGRGPEVQIKLFPVRHISELSDKGVQIRAIFHGIVS